MQMSEGQWQFVPQNYRKDKEGHVSWHYQKRKSKCAVLNLGNLMKSPKKQNKTKQNKQKKNI